MTCQRRASLSSRRSYLINLPPWLIKRCRFGGYFVLISYGKVYLLPFDLPRVYYILECVSDETLTCFFSLPFFFFFCHCLSVSGFFFLESWKKQWRFGRSFEGRLLMAVTPLIFLRWVFHKFHLFIPKKFVLFCLFWNDQSVVFFLQIIGKSWKSTSAKASHPRYYGALSKEVDA